MDSREAEAIAQQRKLMEQSKMDAEPVFWRLSAHMYQLTSIVKSKTPHKVRVRTRDDLVWQNVSPTKSQRVAQFAREHPKAAKRAKVGLVGLALGGLSVILLRERAGKLVRKLLHR